MLCSRLSEDKFWIKLNSGYVMNKWYYYVEHKSGSHFPADSTYLFSCPKSKKVKHYLSMNIIVFKGYLIDMYLIVGHW